MRWKRRQEVLLSLHRLNGMGVVCRSTGWPLSSRAMPAPTPPRYALNARISCANAFTFWIVCEDAVLFARARSRQR
eukprot:2780899-Rhodomonas_salina.1